MAFSSDDEEDDDSAFSFPSSFDEDYSPSGLVSYQLEAAKPFKPVVRVRKTIVRVPIVQQQSTTRLVSAWTKNGVAKPSVQKQEEDIGSESDESGQDESEEDESGDEMSGIDEEKMNIGPMLGPMQRPTAKPSTQSTITLALEFPPSFQVDDHKVIAQCCSEKVVINSGIDNKKNFDDVNKTISNKSFDTNNNNQTTSTKSEPALWQSDNAVVEVKDEQARNLQLLAQLELSASSVVEDKTVEMSDDEEEEVVEELVADLVPKKVSTVIPLLIPKVESVGNSVITHDSATTSVPTQVPATPTTTTPTLSNTATTQADESSSSSSEEEEAIELWANEHAVVNVKDEKARNAAVLVELLTSMDSSKGGEEVVVSFGDEEDDVVSFGDDEDDVVSFGDDEEVDMKEEDVDIEETEEEKKQFDIDTLGKKKAKKEETVEEPSEEEEKTREEKNKEKKHEKKEESKNEETHKERDDSSSDDSSSKDSSDDSSDSSDSSSDDDSSSEEEEKKKVAKLPFIGKVFTLEEVQDVDLTTEPHLKEDPDAKKKKKKRKKEKKVVNTWNVLKFLLCPLYPLQSLLT